MKTIRKSILLGSAAFFAGQLMCPALEVGGPAAMDVTNWTTNSIPYVQGTTDGFSLNWENVLTNTASANIGNNNFELTFETNQDYTLGHIFLYNDAVDLSTVPGGIQQMTWTADFDTTDKGNWIPVIAVTTKANTNSVITSYGTVTGPRDGNQASPMWGQFITPDIGAAGGPHGTLYLQSLSYQAADDGTRATGEVYLHAYTTFSTDGGGAITELGGFTAASTSTVDLGAIAGDGTLTWDFAGNNAFDGATSYMFVASTSPTEVTFADTSSLVGAAYALDVGDPYAGGDSLRGNGGNTGWDQHFEATFDTAAVDEQDGDVTNFYRSDNDGNSWNGNNVLNFTGGTVDNSFWVGLNGDPVGGINETRVNGANPNLQAASGMVQFGFIQWDASTAGIVSPAVDFTTAIDQFDITINELPVPTTRMLDSSAFEATYNGNEIYDGALFINDWAEPGLGGTDVEPELNGEILTVVNNANNGWIELNNGGTVWENGVAAGGSWTAEVRIKLADDVGNGFVIWAANGTERGIMQIDTNAVSPFGRPPIDDSDNTDDFHTFRMAYDSDIGLYFFWRDGVLLTPDGGVSAHAATSQNRFIIGDCCSSYLMTTVEVDYVRFDTTGAFAPDLSRAPLALDITHDAATDNLSISWESEAGRLYNLRSESDPSAAQPIDWPIFEGRANIAATPPLNTVTFPLPAEPLRLFVVEDFPAPPVSIFSDDFEGGQGLWTTGSTGAGGTAWELGAPGVPGPVAANSPTNCFGTNLSATYAVDADVWLRSPPIDLTAASGATLNYFQSLDIETQFDRGSVRVFDAADDSELAVVTAVVEGSVPGWSMITKKLPAAALGKTVVIEFRFQSDEIENYAGWYIDDFEVTVP